MIKKTRLEDAGKYKCVASNVIGHADTFTNLAVRSKYYTVILH
jgi:hypothetical protein